VRLHDDVEAVEEKRARYEEELDRVNNMLTESESRRQALQKEVDLLVEQVILTTELAVTLACSLILSRLDYCNAVLHGAPTDSIQKLQRVQNTAAAFRCTAPTV